MVAPVLPATRALFVGVVVLRDRIWLLEVFACALVEHEHAFRDVAADYSFGLRLL
jgi:hypothetical protein